MSGVDYSKWDKMANELSDSDDENGNSNDPQVTTFNEPQTVTFGGTPASQAAEGWGDGSPTPPNPPTSMDTATAEEGTAAATTAAAGEAATTPGEGLATATMNTTHSSAAPRPKIVAPISDAQLTENGGEVRLETQNGRLHYVWRQTRAEVTIVISAPPGTRAGDVAVSLAAKPETITEGVADVLRVAVKAAGGGGGAQEEQTVLLEGELAFQAKLDGEGDVDWELKDFAGTMVARDSSPDDTPSSAGRGGGGGGGVGGELTREGADRSSSSSSISNAGSTNRRGIEVVLRKHCPIPMAAVWWKSLLKGGPEIDVASIQGRAVNNHQSVWEEALGMFKENVAARKGKGKISVDTGDGE